MIYFTTYRKSFKQKLIWKKTKFFTCFIQNPKKKDKQNRNRNHKNSVVYKKTAVKDFKRIDKSNLKFLTDSILEFTNNFSFEFEQELLKTGKIKKLQGLNEELYRLKLRTYRVIYKKEEDRLIILVVAVKSRENSYRK